MMNFLLGSNPYSGTDACEFFVVLLARMAGFLRALVLGEASSWELASDELQMLVLIGVAAAAALVGSFLVLRKMTMLANALSHTILVGIVIAFILMREAVSHSGHLEIDIQSMVIAALVTGLGTTWLTQWLTNVARLQEDASIGLVFTSLFAIGVVLVTLFTRNAHIGTEIVMGSIDALNKSDLRLVYATLAVDFVIIIAFFKEFTITAFDSALSRALGIRAHLYHYLLMVLLSATVIAAFRVVGVLMVLSFLVGPVITARLLTDHLGRLIIWAVAIGSGASIVGVAIARHLLSVHGIALTTAGVVVCTIIAIYAIVLLGSYVRDRMYKKKKLIEMQAGEV